MRLLIYNSTIKIKTDTALSILLGDKELYA